MCVLMWFSVVHGDQNDSRRYIGTKKLETWSNEMYFISKFLEGLVKEEDDTIGL